ncbi:MAG: hypothetical protein JRK26_11975 [Deltaproteobacteria bacterium]|nr:hypothetical protein [Deltaproteobacteria bacterium]
MGSLRDLLKISENRLKEINRLLTDPNNTIINELLAVIEKYGGVQQINKKAKEAGKQENLLARLKEERSPYLKDLHWLAEQRDKGAFVSRKSYREAILADRSASVVMDEKHAVTLEISALQFFPWLIAEARQAIQNKELMPARYIRVRNMKEQAKDNGDIVATAAAMNIIGATYVETLDTKGTDGSNVHLGGPDTIAGYFGGVGQPNDYPLKWADEYLHYYTTYGIRQALNINPGTVLVGYLLHKLGINNEFKISVFMGNDNPFSILWTLMTAKLFSRDSGDTSLIGFNLSNSANNDTIRKAAQIRNMLGLDEVVRFEHHITETWRSIVRQPYNRREELIEVAREVVNIAAKHEGGECEIEQTLEHPSDVFDYFMSKTEIEEKGLMQAMERNYLEKHRSVNLTAEALIRAGIEAICAWNLHP